jgi:hypothetical protein
MVLAVALTVFVITPIASAQQLVDILHDQWFKIKGTTKGYAISGLDDETVLGKGSGSDHTYLYMAYDGISGTYTLTTCVQDDLNLSIWHKTVNAPISIANIYGAIYPQIWDFGGTPIDIFYGLSTLSVYATFYTKITADGGVLKKATLSTVSCANYEDFDTGEYALGSCKFSGTLIPAAKVLTQVPAACLAP